MYETREDCEHEESGRCTFDYFGGNQGYCNVAGGWMADVWCVVQMLTVVQES